MSRFWSPDLHRLAPYKPGEQPRDQQYIKLNTNENPYPPSPAALETIRRQADQHIRLYPDPESVVLRQAIADHFRLQPEQVFVGNGSDEVLALAFYAFFRRGEPLLFPDLSYSFYPVYCSFFDIPFETPAVDKAFRIRLADYEQPSGGVVFPNPNAPTGRCLPLTEIHRFLHHYRQRVLLIDEAYIDFGGESAAGLIDEFENLLVVQTFSKSRSLAGMRVGFAMGSALLIEGLQRSKNSFNSYPLDRLAQAGAVTSLQDTGHFDRCRDAIIATRENTISGLRGLGFEVIPSTANFVLASPPGGDAQSLYRDLKRKGILVRYFNHPRIERHVRISIGTDAEMQRLLAVLGELYSRTPP